MNNIFLTFVFFFSLTFAEECSPYFKPERFYDSPEYLGEMLEKYKKENKLFPKEQTFDIDIDELYRFNPIDIATEVNGNFGGFWNDWIEDGYEMQLTPESTLFRYNEHYFSLEVFIYGVKGDATKLKGTKVRYRFYNYTPQVMKHIKCKGKK